MKTKRNNPEDLASVGSCNLKLIFGMLFLLFYGTGKAQTIITQVTKYSSESWSLSLHAAINNS